jgi:endonuclease/exonuclease/phosphatase (EEP) superfamily protein YafD
MACCMFGVLAAFTPHTFLCTFQLAFDIHASSTVLIGISHSASMLETSAAVLWHWAQTVVSMLMADGEVQGAKI